jgi:phosphohistidine phosphatase
MNLYLMQHGEARPQEEDSTRPLSQRGRENVARVARTASRSGAFISSIRHSGKLRAKQTADIMAEHLRARGDIEAIAGLAPNDDPVTAARLIAKSASGLLIVGHLPHLSRLLSLLVVGDPDLPIVAFRMGGLIALVRENDDWRVGWHLTPDIVND